MNCYYYKVTIHLRNGAVKQFVQRYFTRNDINATATTNAETEYGKQNILKVDTWWLPESSEEVAEYKKNWL